MATAEMTECQTSIALFAGDATNCRSLRLFGGCEGSALGVHGGVADGVEVALAVLRAFP